MASGWSAEQGGQGEVVSGRSAKLAVHSGRAEWWHRCHMPVQHCPGAPQIVGPKEVASIRPPQGDSCPLCSLHPSN